MITLTEYLNNPCGTLSCLIRLNILITSHPYPSV